MNNRGILFVLSGPSGSGKGTAIKELMGRRPLKLSVSAYTRAPRPGEVDGVQYYFLSKEAVSYTHLDVDKRQPHHPQHARRAGALRPGRLYRRRLCAGP